MAAAVGKGPVVDAFAGGVIACKKWSNIRNKPYTYIYMYKHYSVFSTKLATTMMGLHVNLFVEK